METLIGPLVAMVIGVVGTSVVHLSKGVMRLGVTRLQQGRVAWLVFALSFLGAGGAFVIIQWSYVRGCRAAVMGSAYAMSTTWRCRFCSPPRRCLVPGLRRHTRSPSSR